MSDQRRLAPQDRIVSWGKYAGQRFGDVPTAYLEWFAQNSYKQLVNRRQWAGQELKRRAKENAHVK